MSENETAEALHVTIKGQGVNVAKDVTPEVAAVLVQLLLGSSPAVLFAKPVPAGATIEGQTSGPPKSIQEMITETGASKFPEKITVFGLYLHDVMGVATFRKEEIKEQFSKSAERPPRNFPRDFRDAVAAGWIAAHHKDSEQYYVTTSGRAASNNKFGVRMSKVARKSRTTQKKVSGKVK